jgi:hypothetical protein
VKIPGLVKLSRLGKLGICVSMIVITTRPGVCQDTLPSGGRKSTLSEANGDWRKKSATRFLVVKGDFNGDGHEDLAELWVSDTGKRAGHFVSVSSQHGGWQLLHNAGGSLGDLGTRIVRRKKYETLCGSDPSACAPDTPKAIDLVHIAIEFFSFGRTSSFFYGDKTTQSFRNGPMGD